MQLLTYNDGKEVLNHGGCVGQSLLNAEGLEFVHLRVAPQSILPLHALPHPVFFYVLEGQGTLLTEGDTHEAQPGTLIECPADMPRGWENRTTVDLALLVIKNMEAAPV